MARSAIPPKPAAPAAAFRIYSTAATDPMRPVRIRPLLNRFEQLLKLTSMSDKVACRKCGVSILKQTADRNDGLCVPCKKGYRDSIERSREYYRNERELDRTCPFRAYWRDLVRRVDTEGGGLNCLSDDEKVFYAVGVLDGDVLNGGFVQFFDNSSGEYYRYAELGLMQLEASDRLALLREAKHEIFGSGPVPTAQAQRFTYTSRLVDDSRLNDLDSLYYDLDDNLAGKLDEFALARGLVDEGT